MTNETESNGADHAGNKEPQHGPEVTITIDKKSYQIHRGHQTVAHLKEIAGVSQSFELDEVEDGRLVQLPDDGSVTIKGGEEFKSNLKVGHSS